MGHGTARLGFERLGFERMGFARLAPLLVCALVLLAQLPLILNPGYFSHDELQWAAYSGASGGASVPWLHWTALDAFQYRPLTFNLWLWLSRQLFAQPQAFHALLVAWGATNAALLWVLARRFGVASGPAFAGALVFALGPYASYVHGWVGTLADLIWLSCALLVGLGCVRQPRAWIACTVAALLTAIGLLAKEAAVSIPALLLVAWWFDGRKRRWGAALLGSGAVAALYLAARLGVLLHAPRAGTQYTLSLANLLPRWLEYQLYPSMPSEFETFNTLARGFSGSAIAAATLWLALLLVLWRSGRRLAGIFVIGGVAALGPVLLLGASWNHYAYGFAALAAMVAAAAWPRAARWGRAVLLLAALVSVWHGVNVVRQLRQVGDVQAVFSPALAEVLRGTDRSVRLRPAPDADNWIFARLSHDIPRYDDVEIGKRVTLVAIDAPADYVIAKDGRLLPVR